MAANQIFYTDIVGALSDPIARMEMARTLRRAADLVEKQVIEAANWHFQQIQTGLNLEQAGEMGEAPSAEERELGLVYRADEKMCRVGQMLYQMSYENAAKAIIKLKGIEPPNTHPLEDLFELAGIILPEEIDMQHLSLLTRMNQLGRYTLNKKNEYYTSWSTQYRERREVIDAAIERTWIENRGAYEMADITEIDKV